MRHPRCRAPAAPRQENILYLNGERGGLVNNCCFPSTVAPSYAPAGQARQAPWHAWQRMVPFPSMQRLHAGLVFKGLRNPSTPYQLKRGY